MSNDVPLLTAADARAFLIVLADGPLRDGCLVPPIQAIADGRAVVVPRMSEAEAREKYHRWVGVSDTLYGERAYLAALRDLGAIAPEGK